ncbi:hypothetical protein KHA80_13245 [Anaerobacillus sp. HL2]|nr:hypothetical protein KHA80_13245 [Anaerobacillus sp. HL2]
MRYYNHTRSKGLYYRTPHNYHFADQKQ